MNDETAFQDILARLARIETSVGDNDDLKVDVAIIKNELGQIRSALTEAKDESLRWAEFVRTTYATKDTVTPWITLQKSMMLSLLGISIGAIIFIGTGGAL